MYSGDAPFHAWIPMITSPHGRAMEDCITGWPQLTLMGVGTEIGPRKPRS